MRAQQVEPAGMSSRMANIGARTLKSTFRIRLKPDGRCDAPPSGWPTGSLSPRYQPESAVRADPAMSALHILPRRAYSRSGNTWTSILTERKMFR